MSRRTREEVLNEEEVNLSTSELRRVRQKEEILSHLSRNGGIFIQASQEVGISRRTIDRWRKLDPEFNEAILEILSDQMAFVEGKLMQLINAGDFKAIRYYLNCKGRGGADQVEHKWIENPKSIEAHIHAPTPLAPVSSDNISEKREVFSESALMRAMAKASEHKPELFGKDGEGVIDV